ncbi:hypothetical protein DD630_20260 [Streptomyces sp. BSE7F]|nr:hypothetical protein DD630_20260 [Streptomyces sp. BSE7F]
MPKLAGDVVELQVTDRSVDTGVVAADLEFVVTSEVAVGPRVLDEGVSIVVDILDARVDAYGVDPVRRLQPRLVEPDIQ